jgi:protein O-mannosyl-transferase
LDRTQLSSPLKNLGRAALVAGVLAMAVYANSLANGFAYDDAHVILENTELQSLETLPGAVFKPYWHGHDDEALLGLWRPTTTLMLGLEFAVAGDSPFLYHLVNVIGHGLATALVVLVLGQLVTIPIALTAGLLFAVHPVHVEAVANVVGGAEVLATVFVLLALLVHLRGPSTWLRALAVGGLYALAFGAKESAVTLLALLFLVDAGRHRLGFSDLPAYLRETWKTYAAVTAVAAVMLTARMQVLGSIASPEAALGGGLLLEIPRIWTLSEVWSHYVRLMVFPLDLASDYSPGVIPISMSWHALNFAGVMLALVALGGALALWRRPALGSGSESGRIFALGVVWFLIAVSPVANILFVSGVLLAERTLYLPSVGAAAGLAWLLVMLVRRRRDVGLVAIGVVVLLMSVRSWTRTPTWKDDGKMFETLIAEYPHSGRSQWLMGDIYMTQGQTSEALQAYREAIPNLGASYGLTTQIARKLMGAGNGRGAAHLLEQVRLEAPDFGTAPALLGVIYTQLAEWENAERSLSAAVRLQPDNVVSHHLRAGALAELERWEEAAAERREVIAMGEDVWQQWRALAEVEERAGNVDAARTALAEARSRVSTDEERAEIDSLVAALDEGRF